MSFPYNHLNTDEDDRAERDPPADMSRNPAYNDGARRGNNNNNNSAGPDNEDHYRDDRYPPNRIPTYDQSHQPHQPHPDGYYDDQPDPRYGPNPFGYNPAGSHADYSQTGPHDYNQTGSFVDYNQTGSHVGYDHHAVAPSDFPQQPGPDRYQSPYQHEGFLGPSDHQYDMQTLGGPTPTPPPPNFMGHYASDQALNNQFSMNYLDGNPLVHHAASQAFSNTGNPAGDYIGHEGVVQEEDGNQHLWVTDGKLILDCKLPSKLISYLGISEDEAFRERWITRYTAVTGDPSFFNHPMTDSNNEPYRKGYSLRQLLFGTPRKTEILIAITMYNEDDVLFARTMIGVIKNIQKLNDPGSDAKKSQVWGQDPWKRIVVAVISDGRANINKRTLALLSAMGVYQGHALKSKVGSEDVSAHVFENTTTCDLQIVGNTVHVKPGGPPIQMIFCLKEKNKKKINSHRWFFQAFADSLKPNVCVLLDAGTKPGGKSIYDLWRCFNLEPKCGGACGEIKAMIPKFYSYLNFVIASQNFEYKMSNILDKPFESSFGYISVLPGAFSAYRYAALAQRSEIPPGGVGNKPAGKDLEKAAANEELSPLDKYFLGETMHGTTDENAHNAYQFRGRKKKAGIFEANMYLAEDRILCFELVAMRNNSWILQYVKSATGETDVPDEMSEFIKQRRRWLNGSFFAAIYAIVHCLQIFRSNHSFIRKIFFMFEFLYQTINMLFAWFAIGNFFLVFRILTEALSDKTLLGGAGHILATVLQFLYVATLITCFVLSLGNKPTDSKRFYVTCAWFWAILMLYLMFASIFITVRSIQLNGKFDVEQLYKNTLFFNLIVSLLSTVAMYLIASLIFLDPYHMFTCFIQYMLMTPTYINILNVYAFCNTDDVSWGTKETAAAPELGSVELKDGKKEQVKVSLPTMEEIDIQYELDNNETRKEPVVLPAPPNAAAAQEAYYKTFRSVVVLLWIFSNLVLCGLILLTGNFAIDPDENRDDEARIDQKARIYMAVVLWSVAGLSAIRFIGCVWFQIVRIFRGV